MFGRMRLTCSFYPLVWSLVISWFLVCIFSSSWPLFKVARFDINTFDIQKPTTIQWTIVQTLVYSSFLFNSVSIVRAIVYCHRYLLLTTSFIHLFVCFFFFFFFSFSLVIFLLCHWISLISFVRLCFSSSFSSSFCVVVIVGNESTRIDIKDLRKILDYFSLTKIGCKHLGSLIKHNCWTILYYYYCVECKFDVFCPFQWSAVDFAYMRRSFLFFFCI